MGSLLKISELQRLIKRLINEGSDIIMDLVHDAQTIASELLREAMNAEAILQYVEGAILEIMIIATLLRIDVEKVLQGTLKRLETKRIKYYAE